MQIPAAFWGNPGGKILKADREIEGKGLAFKDRGGAVGAHA